MAGRQGVQGQSAMIEMWLQYNHLDREYGYLPGMTPARIAALLGLGEPSYVRLIQEFDTRAKDAAQRLLTDPRCADLVDRLPIPKNATIVGIGDSVTSDRQSWLEILRHAIASRRAADDVTVVNAGLSAHTSAMVLRRCVALLTAQPPTLVICCLGINDVTRIGPEPSVTQVSLDETIRNLAELRRLGRILTSATWVWVTPPTIDEARVAAFPGFRQGQSTWRNEDLAAVARRIQEFADPIVDTQSVFGRPPQAELQGPDGVHPSLAGQAAIARAVIERLSLSSDAPGPELVEPR